MGSAMGLSGNFYEFNDSATPAEADTRAMQSDWSMIGRDLSEAMGQVAQQQRSRQQKAAKSPQG
jgi:hypothetical protein